MNSKKNDVGTSWTQINYMNVKIWHSFIRNEEFFIPNRPLTILYYSFILWDSSKIFINLINEHFEAELTFNEISVFYRASILTHTLDAKNWTFGRDS